MKRRTPAPVAASTTAWVPAILPASKPFAIGAFTTPATWITASAPRTSVFQRHAVVERTGDPGDARNIGLGAAGEGADLMACLHRQLDQPACRQSRCRR